MTHNPFTDIVRLFFPPACAVCGKTMPQGADFICSHCRFEIPLTGFWKKIDNPVVNKFYGHLPVVNACAFFYFVYDSRFRGLVHKFKYAGSWRFAEKMGRWFGAELKECGLYDDIDIIVPVPLHLRKLLTRGYNQSEYIAEGIGVSMVKPVDNKSVIRKVHNKSQTSRSYDERWENVEGIFSVKKNSSLNGKHILLVDDVLTTGATIISCGEAILKACPDSRISIVTLAVTRE